MKNLMNLTISVCSLIVIITGCNTDMATNEHSNEKSTIAKAEPENTEFILGKTYYSQYCMVCHQQDGKGVPGLNPPLINTEWVIGDKERLIGVILNGLNEEIEISGESYSNTMGSFASLSDKEIALILSFIRKSFGNEGELITEGDVSRVRKNLIP